MNVIKVYLAESGRVASLDKNFPLYQGQYDNVLLNVYVPTSILSPEFRTSQDDVVISDFETGNAVSVAMTYQTQSGLMKESAKRYMRYLKTITYNNVEYALFERRLPQEFTFYVGQGANAPIMIINVVDIDTDDSSIIRIVTSQKVAFDVMPSDRLDKDEEIEPSEVERINAIISAIDADLALKQDKMDESLTTASKSVVGAINEINGKTSTNIEQIASNTARIITNEQDIALLKQSLGTSETFITQITTSEEMPLSEEYLNSIVEEIVSRETRVGDVITVIQEISGETDKLYKYIFNASGWVYYEIQNFEQASNTEKGVIKGNYGSSADTQISVVGGEIVGVYTKDISSNTLRPIGEFINANKSSIDNIISGEQQVGKANSANTDGLGNNIVNTYMTQTAGASKQDLRDYALPREFNDTYYIGADGYSTDAPSGSIQFQAISMQVGYTQLFAIQMTNDAEFELSKKNSYSNQIVVSASVAGDYQFRLVTQAYTNGTWKTLNVELSDVITWTTESAMKTLSFGSTMASLGESIIKLTNGDKIKQTLEVLTETSTQTRFYVYSNSTYPSTFNLNTQAVKIVTSQGMLGEQPRISATGVAVNDTIEFTIPNEVQLNDKVEALFTFNYVGELTNNPEFVCKWNEQVIRLVTPYNYDGGNPTREDFEQVNQDYNQEEGYTWTFKGFIENNGADVSILVDIDNLSQLKTEIEDNTNDIGDIRALIPEDTTEDNKLTNQSQLNELDEKIKEIQLFKFPNAVIIGEPTINNGQVSGFSADNYMIFPFILDVGDRNFQIDFSFTTGNDVTTQQNVLDSYFGLALAIKDGKGLMAISTNGTSWAGSVSGTMNILPNTTYYARLSWNRLQYKTALSTNGIDYTDDMTAVIAQRPYPRTIYIGGGNATELQRTPNPFFGIINMNKASLSIAGQLVWTGMDDVGLATRADVSLSNLDEQGEKRFTDLFDAIGVKYTKPSTGIPKSDLASDIQSSLDKADNSLPNTTKYGAYIDLVWDNQTEYKLKAQLKNQDGTVMSTSSVIDLPLESVVVSGSYDKTNKKIILTLENGSTVDIPVGDLVAGLQSEITASNKLNSDLVDDTNQANKFVSATDKSNWNGYGSSISTINIHLGLIDEDIETINTSLTNLSQNKQNNLSTTQLSATNSGITSTKVQTYDTVAQQYLKNATVNSTGTELTITKQDGSSVTFAGGGGSAEVAEAVKDQKTQLGNKQWTGTLAEYNAITTKDPNTLYFIIDDEVDGGVTLTTLWTNPNPTATFSPQTITLDLSSYKFIIVYSTVSQSSTNKWATVVIKNQLTYAFGFDNNSTPICGRNCFMTDNGVQFDNGYYNWGSGWSTGNDKCIPYQIIGVK